MHESLQIDAVITNCIIKDNYSKKSAVFLSFQNMGSGKNNLEIWMNVFKNNTSQNHGGLFQFISASFNLILKDNIYQDNRAGGSGGIGFISHSISKYVEENGYYLSIFL